jgi:hypothetical protein
LVAGGLMACLPIVRPVRGGDRRPAAGDEIASPSDQPTEAQRRADPESYFVFVRERLEQEKAELAPACESLKLDIARQNEAIQEKVNLWQKAKEVAETFREHYQRAKKSGQWPVEVDGFLYCEQQLLSQVSMLMEEAKGLAECVTNMKAARERAEAKLEELTVRDTKVDSQLSICTTRFELWKASRLRSDGDRLLACLEQLIENEPPQLARCSARTDDGFPAIPNGLPQPHRNMNPVRRYLEFVVMTDVPKPAKRQQQRPVSQHKPCQKPIYAQN